MKMCLYILFVVGMLLDHAAAVESVTRAPATCHELCELSGHGACTSLPSGKGKYCKCDDGYRGVACQAKYCPGVVAAKLSAKLNALAEDAATVSESQDKDEIASLSKALKAAGAISPSMLAQLHSDSARSVAPASDLEQALGLGPGGADALKAASKLAAERDLVEAAAESGDNGVGDAAEEEKEEAAKLARLEATGGRDPVALCGGHGVCQASTGECRCSGGWHGPDCKTREGEEVKTPEGDEVKTPKGEEVKQAEKKDCEEDKDCGGSEAGKCGDDGKCLCSEGRAGKHCEKKLCSPNDCSGHGKCNHGSGSCHCQDGWQGAGCNEKAPVVHGTVVGKVVNQTDGDSTPRFMSVPAHGGWREALGPSSEGEDEGEGAEVEEQETGMRFRSSSLSTEGKRAVKSTERFLVVCEPGWTGSDCSVRVKEAACNGGKGCSGHGQCTQYGCICEGEWFGPRCDVTANGAQCPVGRGFKPSYGSDDLSRAAARDRLSLDAAVEAGIVRGAESTREDEEAGGEENESKPQAMGTVFGTGEGGSEGDEAVASAGAAEEGEEAEDEEQEELDNAMTEAEKYEDEEDAKSQPVINGGAALREKAGLPRFAARRGDAMGPGVLQQSNWGGDFDQDSTDDDGPATDELAAALAAAQGSMGGGPVPVQRSTGVLGDAPAPGQREFASMRAVSTVAAQLMQSGARAAAGVSDARQRHFEAASIGALERVGVVEAGDAESKEDTASRQAKKELLSKAAAFIAAADEPTELQERHEYRHGLGSGRQCSGLGLCAEDGSCRCYPGYGGDSCQLRQVKHGVCSAAPEPLASNMFELALDKVAQKKKANAYESKAGNGTAAALQARGSVAQRKDEDDDEPLRLVCRCGLVPAQKAAFPGQRYTGPSCDKLSCPKDCSGRGSCGEHGQCLCPPGWTGDACDKPSCVDMCGGRGKCIVKRVPLDEVPEGAVTARPLRELLTSADRAAAGDAAAAIGRRSSALGETLGSTAAAKQEDAPKVGAILANHQEYPTEGRPKLAAIVSGSAQSRAEHKKLQQSKPNAGAVLAGAGGTKGSPKAGAVLAGTSKKRSNKAGAEASKTETALLQRSSSVSRQRSKVQARSYGRLRASHSGRHGAQPAAGAGRDPAEIVSDATSGSRQVSHEQHARKASAGVSATKQPFKKEDTVVAAFCECEAGYAGAGCGTKVCPVANCSGHGKCDEATGTCKCTGRWYGAACDKHRDRQCPGACGAKLHRGMCHDGTCYCAKGFTGPSCSSVLCPSSCSGNGVCNMTTGACQCNSGWGGEACSKRTCPVGMPPPRYRTSANVTGAGSKPRPPPCSGVGECVDGQCHCPAPYIGHDCSLRVLAVKPSKPNEAMHPTVRAEKTEALRIANESVGAGTHDPSPSQQSVHGSAADIFGSEPKVSLSLGDSGHRDVQNSSAENEKYVQPKNVTEKPSAGGDAAVTNGVVAGSEAAQGGEGEKSYAGLEGAGTDEDDARALARAKAQQHVASSIGSWLTGFRRGNRTAGNETAVPVDRRHYSATGPIATLFF